MPTLLRDVGMAPNTQLCLIVERETRSQTLFGNAYLRSSASAGWHTTEGGIASRLQPFRPEGAGQSLPLGTWGVSLHSAG